MGCLREDIVEVRYDLMGNIGGEAVFEHEGAVEFVFEEGSLKHLLDYLLIAERLGL